MVLLIWNGQKRFKVLETWKDVAKKKQDYKSSDWLHCQILSVDLDDYAVGTFGVDCWVNNSMHVTNLGDFLELMWWWNSFEMKLFIVLLTWLNNLTVIGYNFNEDDDDEDNVVRNAFI